MSVGATARRVAWLRTDVRLRAWVDQIWLPFVDDDDSPVAVTMGAAPPTHVVAEEYAVLPHPRAARYLVPVGSKQAAVSSFRDYAAVRSALSRTARQLLASGYATGLNGQVFRHRLVVSVDRRFPRSRWGEVLVLQHLARVLAHPQLLAFTAVRQVNPNAKPTLRLFDPSGDSVGFAKLGSSPATRDMVRAEAAAMLALHGKFDSLLVPRLLHRGEWGPSSFVIGSPLPRELRRCTQHPDQTITAVREIARAGESGPGPLAGSAYVKRLRSDLAASQSAGEVHAVLGSWLERLEANPAPLRFGWMHGDWIPDNVGRCGSMLAAWDWEHSAPDSPVGFDLLHWHFHKALVAAGLPAAIRAVDAATPQLALLGVPTESRPLVASLYLLDAFVRRLRLALGGGGWTARWYPGLLDVARHRDGHRPGPATPA